MVSENCWDSVKWEEMGWGNGCKGVVFKFSRIFREYLLKTFGTV
jgi:hypothetical protein